MNTRASANLAETGNSQPTLAAIRAEKQRLEQQETEIIQAEATAREQRRQQSARAALSSASKAIQPAQNAIDAAESELSAAVKNLVALATTRDAAAKQFANALREVRRNCLAAGVTNEEINDAIGGFEKNRRKAVSVIDSCISGARSFDDALLELERRQHWLQHNDAGSLVIVITRKAG